MELVDQLVIHAVGGSVDGVHIVRSDMAKKRFEKVICLAE